MVQSRQIPVVRHTSLKFASAVIALLLLLGLSGCTEDTSSEWSAYQLAAETAGDEAAAMSYISQGSELYEQYVGDYYGLDAGTVLDGAVLAVTGASAQEVAVFRFGSQSEAEEAAGLLSAYAEARQGDFVGYMPEQAEMLADAHIVTHGEWCALIVLPDSATAAETFEQCLESAPPEDAQPAPSALTGELTTPAATDSADGWTYSEQRLIDAYRSGNWAAANDRDREILEIVDQVLTEVAPDSMSQVERELAIHDYMVENIRYDSDSLSLLPVYSQDPDNDNPYGALVNGRAICRGYATSFQLFMDLAGIECITVEGEANYDREEHAWNMVRLDGDWYCVDVTWDDPTGSGLMLSDSVAHRYFNVTSEFMRGTNHFWDAESVPEAEGTRWAWENAAGLAHSERS